MRAFPPGSLSLWPWPCHSAISTPPPKGYEYVLYLDFDAIFEPRVFVGHHPLEPLVVSQKSVILLAEMALCSCHFFVKNSAFGRGFVQSWVDRCSQPNYCTRGRVNHTRPSDQIAYDILLFEKIAEYEQSPRLQSAIRAPGCRSVGACIADSASPVFWRCAVRCGVAWRVGPGGGSTFRVSLFLRKVPTEHGPLASFSVACLLHPCL